MRNLTSKEKVDILNGTPLENIHTIENMTTSGIVQEDLERRRIVCRVDFRSRVKEWMKEEGITQRELARLMGVHFQYLNGFLRGAAPLRYDLMEMVLWLMEPGNMVTDAESETRIIKTTH